MSIKCPNLGQLPTSQSSSRISSFEFRPSRPFNGKTPPVGLAVPFNTNRYEDELRSIRFWFSMTLGWTRRVLEMGR